MKQGSTVFLTNTGETPFVAEKPGLVTAVILLAVKRAILSQLASLCYTKCCATSFAVALVSGYDRSWTDWNTWSHRGAGSYG
jgi:hypothetical protein